MEMACPQAVGGNRCRAFALQHEGVPAPKTRVAEVQDSPFGFKERRFTNRRRKQDGDFKSPLLDA
jgi:hypothetical protein